MTPLWIRFTIGIIYFIICAIVAKHIMKKKGYYEDANDWFWMGLLFGVFALMIVLLKRKKANNEGNKPVQ